jgi:hypothetical protein
MELYQICLLILAGEMILNIIGMILYADLADKWDVLVPMPSDFKDNTEMNWFGCVICYLVLFILFPISNICKLIYWLFHI